MKPDRLTLERCEHEKEIKQLRRALKMVLKVVPDEDEYIKKPDSDYVFYSPSWHRISLAKQYAQRVLKEGAKRRT